MTKNDNVVEMRAAADSNSSLDDFHGTSEDAKDMCRLGRSQELKVRAVSAELAYKGRMSIDTEANRETSTLCPFLA